MNVPMDCRMIGRGQNIVDMWEHGYVDLCGPPLLNIRADGHRDVAFGVFQASLRIAYGHLDVAFDWEGDDELHGVRGTGSSEILEDGSLEIEFD